MSDGLSKVFGLEPIKESLPEKKEDNTNLSDDSIEARKNIKVLIETGNRALEEALNLAIESESPRAYEVLTNLINTLADLNTRVIDVHGKTVDIKRKSNEPNKNQSGLSVSGEQPESPSVVNNNNTVFVGTTSELAKFLTQLQQNNQKDVFENEPKQDK